jgi:hypothetical protein
MGGRVERTDALMVRVRELQRERVELLNLLGEALTLMDIPDREFLLRVVAATSRRPTHDKEMRSKREGDGGSADTEGIRDASGTQSLRADRVDSAASPVLP